MIEFGDAFLALNVIPQAATTGARAAGTLQIGSRGTCGRNSLYPRVVPRDATGATRFAPPSCEVRRRRVHKPSIQISRGRRVQRQSATGGSQGREPAKPGRSRVVSMTVSIIHGTGGWTPRPSAGTPNRPFSLTAFRVSS